MGKRGNPVLTYKDYKNPEKHSFYIEGYERGARRHPSVIKFLINKHGLNKIAFMEDVSPNILRKRLFGSHTEFVKVMAKIDNLNRIRTKQLNDKQDEIIDEESL